MDKDEITGWALKNGWQMIAGFPSLVKPNSPKDAIVRLVFKATVASLEIKKPAGKWEKVAGANYPKVTPHPETGMPLGLGLETMPGLSNLMRDNKDRMVFAKPAGGTPSSQGRIRFSAIARNPWSPA